MLFINERGDLVHEIAPSGCGKAVRRFAHDVARPLSAGNASQPGTEPYTGDGFDGDRDRIPCWSELALPAKEVEDYARNSSSKTCSREDPSVEHGPIRRCTSGDETASH